MRGALRRLIVLLDETFDKRFEVAQACGRIDATIAASLLGRQTTAIVQSLALRARSGAAVRELQEVASAAVQLITAR